jgi:prepilin-type N-terminal cleavage/methylation domain-containing protein
MRDRRGFGLVEIALALVVAAILGAVAYAYFASTARTLEQVREERPMSQARLAADRATVTAIRSTLQMYYGQNGQWPPTKEAVAALMSPPPAFQCTGNDFTYDPGTGEVRLLNDDLGRC